MARLPDSHARSFSQRLLAMNWSLLWLIPITGMLIAALYWWGRGDRPPQLAECARLYSAAHSSADSLVVDETVPLASSPKGRDQSVKCGLLRRLGKVPTKPL